MAGDKLTKEDLEIGDESRDVHPRALSNAGSRQQSMSRSMRGTSAGLSASFSRSQGLGYFGGSNPFEAATMGSTHEQDEEALKWAALEKLPTFNRLRTSIFEKDTGSIRHIDVEHLSSHDIHHLLTKFQKVTDDDNEQILAKVRKRLDKVGIDLPTVEVRYENLNIKANCHVGNRGLPTLLNVVRDIVEVIPAPRFKIVDIVCWKCLVMDYRLCNTPSISNGIFSRSGSVSFVVARASSILCICFQRRRKSSPFWTTSAGPSNLAGKPRMVLFSIFGSYCRTGCTLEMPLS